MWRYSCNWQRCVHMGVYSLSIAPPVVARSLFVLFFLFLLFFSFLSLLVVMSVCLLHDCFLYLSLCKLCSVDTSEEEAREGKEEKSLFFLLPPILSSFFLILPYSLWRGDQNHKLFFVCDWEVFFIIVSVPCIKHNVCLNPHVCARICVCLNLFLSIFSGASSRLVHKKRYCWKREISPSKLSTCCPGHFLVSRDAHLFQVWLYC